MSKLRIGTRGSALALWQAGHVADLLTSRLPEIEIEQKIIKTTGDKILKQSLVDIGEKALFTKEIEEALLADEIDIAVHSLKDLPTTLPEGLALGAILKRGPQGDVFVSKTGASLAEVPFGSTVATGSLRRRAQLLHSRPDLKIVDLRGNVQTRLRKLSENDWAGIVLAEAGLVRLNLEEKITERLSPEIMLSAVGQGAVAVEARDGDERVAPMLEILHHEETATCVLSERSFLRYLEGGCQVPIAASGTIREGRLILEGLLCDLDGKALIRDQITGSPSDAEALGEQLAEKILNQGGQSILDSLR